MYSSIQISYNIGNVVQLDEIVLNNNIIILMGGRSQDVVDADEEIIAKMLDTRSRRRGSIRKGTSPRKDPYSGYVQHLTLYKQRTRTAGMYNT